MLRHHPSWPGCAVQIIFYFTSGIQVGSVSEAIQGAGGVEIGRVALLSEEGSTIETAVEIARGVVP